jgi:hypothetical protein
MIKLKTLLFEQESERPEVRNRDQLIKYLLTYRFKSYAIGNDMYYKNVLETPNIALFIRIIDDSEYNKTRGFQPYTVELLLRCNGLDAIDLIKTNKLLKGRLSSVTSGWYEIDEQKRNSRKYVIDTTESEARSIQFKDTPAYKDITEVMQTIDTDIKQQLMIIGKTLNLLPK